MAARKREMSTYRLVRFARRVEDNVIQSCHLQDTALFIIMVSSAQTMPVRSQVIRNSINLKFYFQGLSGTYNTYT